jgi:hypothetical protein
LKLKGVFLKYKINDTFFTTYGSRSICFILNINCNKMFH